MKVKITEPKQKYINVELEVVESKTNYYDGGFDLKVVEPKTVYYDFKRVEEKSSVVL